MRRVLGIVLVATMAFVVTASAADAKSKPKKAPVVVLTTAQLTPAMLALEDMPTGWAGQPLPASAFQASTTDGLCNGPNAFARVQAAGVASYAGSQFSQDPNNGPTIAELAYVFPTLAAANGFTAATKQALAGCTAGWQTANPNVSGGSVQWAITPLSFTKLGDSTQAARETATNQYNGQAGASATIDIVYVEVGNNVISINRAGATSLVGSATTDAGQLLTYTQKALSKLGVALAAAKKTAATTTTKPKKKKK